MFKIGLTGGIGSGKSTVSDLFKQLAIPVIDADDIAHELVAPDQPALTQISTAFGLQSLNPDGSLNRAELREVIFQNTEKKHQLESILHPLVYAEIEHQINQLNSPYIIVSIPLLLETGMQSLVDHILVVDCPVEMQINRVKLRNKMNEAQIMLIINSQINRAERLAQADSIIDNTQDLSYLNQQVNNLHIQFLKQAQ